MKKRIALIAAVMILLAACGMAEGKTIGSAADAEEFLAVLLGDHPEAAEGVWALTDQMEAAVRQKGGMAGLAKQLAPLGELKGVQPAREATVQGLQAFFVPCRFSLVSVDLILAVQDGALAGLSTGVYSGKSEEGTADWYSLELPLPVPALGDLPGILTLPKGEGPFPAVVLVHGSGSSDRDETMGLQKPFRDLAEGLAARGIAVYRFDKRTFVFGSKLANDTQLTLMEESVEDAVNAVQMLAKQERIDPDRIFVLGHSLGGTAVPAISREMANAPARACGFIMMAASPRSLDVLMREQIAYLYSLRPEGTNGQEMDRILQELDRLQDLDALAGDERIAGAYKAYWKWLADYDALQAAGEIGEPVLLLQGEEDYQVTMEDFSLWQAAFGERDGWTLISYPGLTHAFTAGLKTEGAAVYARPGKVDSRVIGDVAGFILRNPAEP